MTTSYEKVGDEREVLLHFLNKMRTAVVRVSEGLTDAEQRAPGAPSGTSLLGLVRHLTYVEQHWFQHVFLGSDTGLPNAWTVPDSTTHAEVVAAYQGL